MQKRHVSYRKGLWSLVAPARTDRNEMNLRLRIGGFWCTVAVLTTFEN